MRYANGQNKPLPGVRVAWGHPLARDLYVHYLFHEGNGTKLRDVGGRALLDATLNNMDPATDWVGSDRGGCLDFDGTDDSASSITGYSLNGVAAASYVVWFRVATAPTNEYLVASPQGSVTNGFDLRLDSDTVIRLFVNGTITSSSRTMTVPSFADSRWHQVAAAYDGGTIRLYFDGVLIASTASAFGTIQAALGELNICRFSSGLHAGPAARVGGLRVYKRALHADEVRWLYADPYADLHRAPVWLRKDRLHSALEIEAQLDGSSWTDLTADARYPIEVRYGIQGAGPTDLVAGPGSMSFPLSNGRRRGNPVGYYSPDHVDCRPGFGIGTKVRAVWRNGGTGTARVKHVGWLEAIDPTAGQYKGLVTQCVSLDWMHQAAGHSPVVPTQTSKKMNEVISTLVAAVPRQPESTSLATGVTTFPYVLDNSQSERQPVLTEFQKLALSEFARIYMRGDGTLVSDNRNTRLTPSVVASFDDDMVDLRAPHDRSRLRNRIKASIHPRTVDAAATTVLATLGNVNPSQHSVPAGESVTIEMDYSDPALRDVRVGGTDMVTPVATTDFLMNAAADGSGANLTASFTVTATFGANRVKLVVSNGSASLGYIRLLQVRGRGLYDYSPVEVIVADQGSIDDYGEALLSLDMPHQPDVNTAKSVAEYLLTFLSEPGAYEAVLRVHAFDDDGIDAIMAREPGHAISVIETATGIAFTYYINGVSIHIRGRYDVSAEWILSQAPVGDFFTLDSATLGQLDENVLAPL